ncbi:hypothetical protein LOTGIDRAFT_175538 [Lottia gigantea]|uniref:Mutator-like transposase domain-containing protein n=1 Tax=Lottia gigantea TaxID=225164 RepID=V4AIZ1_LOTGI|nr:hypothetical protein LOTGIDRAFT_175538 [Lottia gigantea]ESO93471.1 hypothetical protein LOTGIDRAFT_175538 [Lottia gigantea]
MPPIHFTTYSSRVSAISLGSEQLSSGYFSEAGCIVRKVQKELNPDINIEGVIDLAVSFDASWLTKGHSSMYAVAFIIEVITGLVLDFHVVSTFCHACSFAKTKYGSGIEFEEWYLKHKPHCNINFSGSSNAMEVEAAKVLWSRSLDSGFRYSTLISDGDSKSYDHINNLKLYNVEKQECINHVAKRMGTALRKLAKDGKKLGVVLGGKGQGKLTQTTINKLTIYYGKAIRENLDNLDAMRDAVYANFLHALSTESVPHHNR